MNKAPPSVWSDSSSLTCYREITKHRPEFCGLRKESFFCSLTPAPRFGENIKNSPMFQHLSVWSQNWANPFVPQIFVHVFRLRDWTTGAGHSLTNCKCSLEPPAGFFTNFCCQDPTSASLQLDVQGEGLSMGSGAVCLKSLSVQSVTCQIERCLISAVEWNTTLTEASNAVVMAFGHQLDSKGRDLVLDPKWLHDPCGFCPHL